MIETGPTSKNGGGPDLAKNFPTTIAEAPKKQRKSKARQRQERLTVAGAGSLVLLIAMAVVGYGLISQISDHLPQETSQPTPAADILTRNAALSATQVAQMTGKATVEATRNVEATKQSVDATTIHSTASVLGTALAQMTPTPTQLPYTPACVRINNPAEDNYIAGLPIVVDFFRAILIAGNPKIIEEGPYIMDRNFIGTRPVNDPPKFVNDWQDPVFNGDIVCVNKNGKDLYRLSMAMHHLNTERQAIPLRISARARTLFNSSWKTKYPLNNPAFGRNW